MENQKTFHFGKNIFANAFREFDENSFFQQLENRVKPQSYFHKYQGFKTLILTLSYLFNIISAFTASYLIFWFTQWLTGISWIAYVLSAVFLFFLEKLKRKSSGEFFQIWFFEKQIATGWLGLSLAIFAASVISTYFGTDRATWDFAPTAPIIQQDSTLQQLYNQLALTEIQISEARDTKWRGTTTRTSQQTVKELSEQKSQILTEIGRREQKKDTTNENIVVQHDSKISITASTLAWLTVLFEILFECCIAYIWYYYHRSFVEHKQLGLIHTAPSPTPPKQLPIDASIIILLQELQQQLHLLQQQNKPESHDFSTQKPNQNGSENGVEPHGKRPMGFFTESQKKSYNILQDVVTDEKIFFEDRHTITHKDSRTGVIKRYTLPRVDNFISHYEKAVQEAQKSSMEADVLSNRKNWLMYWKGKKAELEIKQKYV